jgi:hypothetical protein
MTTSRSPHHRLKAQADGIARSMKAAQRGEVSDPRLLEALRSKPTLKTGVVMDDKIIRIELSWDMIRDIGETELSEMILEQMQKESP